MAAVRHLGFWKFKFFNITAPNFAKIGQSVVVRARFLCFFKIAAAAMAAAAILVFKKFELLTICPL